MELPDKRMGFACVSSAELKRMTLAMEQNESPDPLHVGLLGADAIVPRTTALRRAI